MSGCFESHRIFETTGKDFYLPFSYSQVSFEGHEEQHSHLVSRRVQRSQHPYLIPKETK